MSPLLFLLLVFLGAVVGLLGVFSIVSDLVLRDRRINRRVQEEFHRQPRSRLQGSPLFKDLNKRAIEAAAQDQPRPGLWQRFEEMIEQSGLNTRPSHVLAWSGGALSSRCSWGCVWVVPSSPFPSQQPASPFPSCMSGTSAGSGWTRCSPSSRMPSI